MENIVDRGKSETRPNFLKAKAMKKYILFISLALALCAQGQQSISLLQPTAGSTWQGAQTYPITWEAQNINLIKIEFSANGGISWQLVEAAYPATAFSYHWTVPAQPTDSARIRLSDSENPAIYSVSGLFTIPEPYINLVQPQNLAEDNAYAIRWESSCIFHVDILFSTDNGQNWDTIYKMVDAVRGNQNWPLPEAAENCLLKLMDAANPEMFDISAPFDIAAAPIINPAKYHGGSFDGYARNSNLTPQLEILSPTGGETWDGSTEQWLTWDAENTFRIMILFSTDGGNTWPDTLQNLYPAEALKYLITVPNTPTNQARFKLVSLDVPGLEAESGDFIIPEPFIEIQNDFESLFTGTPYPIFWESSGVPAVDVFYSPDNAATWDTIVMGVPATRGIKNWKVPESTDEARIRVSDSTGNILSEAGPFAIAELPAANPAKYHGGSFDGYVQSSNITPALAITNPTGGETWDGSTEQTLQWEAVNTFRIMILFSTDDGQTWPDTLQELYPAEAGKLNITIPNIPTNTARFKLVSLDVEGLEVISEPFVIPEPFITITNTFENLKTGTPYPIFWESSGVSHVNIGYSPDGGTTWDTIGWHVPATRGIKNWKVPEPTTNGIIIVSDTVQVLSDQVNNIAITELPQHNPIKYQGGSYDGYAMSVFQVAEFGCPPDTALCEDEPAFEPLATPPGGTFSGTGMVAGAFDPTTAGPGVHEITYTYTYFNGSSTSCTFFITVYPMPEVNCPAPMDVCIDAAPFELLGATPANGTFTGAGVQDGTFDPAEAGTGEHIIQYSFTSADGCTETCAFTITVHELPELSCPENMEVCEDVESLALPQATPTGGIYSGATVENDMFYPAQAGPGTYTITYSYTDEFQCGNTCQFQITVHPLPAMTCPDDLEVCVDAAPFELPEGEPGNGTFSGAGVDNITFYPDVAGPGTHEILYSFTDQNGCSNSCAFFVTVHPLPQLTCPASSEMCINDAPLELTGAMPAGGAYTGNGVSEGVFDPAMAGDGIHQITYTYSDENACTNQCVFEITVHPLPVVTCPADIEVCMDEAPVTLDSGQPEGGSYAGNGVTDGTFNPALAGAGIHEITYTFTDENTCTNSCSFYVVVNPLPEMACPDSYALCVDAGVTDLPEALPDGGEYAGTGVSGSQFDPELAGIGTHSITYSFTDNNGCTNDCSFDITVNDLPGVSCPENMEICIDHQPISLQGGNPAGGIYTGTGISDGVFYPDVAGPGNHEITYTFTDENACANQCSFYILVNPLPELSCPEDMIVCISGDPFSLETAQPKGGTYAGPGVDDGVFDPQMAGAGDHEITYTFTDENSCTATCNFIISVKPLPQMSCPGSFMVCENAEPFTLSGASPAGGTYTGNGVMDNVFNPAIAGTGIQSIIYTYQDEFGCENSCGFNITVLPAPEVSCPGDMEVCIDEAAFVVEGLSPEGGALSGAGVSNGMFDPAIAGAGTHELTWVYTSPVNFCTNSCSFLITVHPLPEIICGNDIELCLDAGPVELTNGLPQGGSYSGTGVVDGVFDPASAGVGTHTISYQYTDENSCTAECAFEITVHPVPEPTCPADMGVCIYADPVELEGVNPEGGTFSGDGISAGIFYPENAGVGVHEILYSYTNAFGCAGSCNFTIEVYPIPEITCDVPEEVCKYEGPVLLQDCSPGGGTYTGTGVAGNTFFPEIADIGEHEITYHYTDPETGCENESSFTIRVKPSQLIEIPNGWTGISSFLIPENDDITEMFTDMQNELVMLYNLDGDVYFPGGNIYPANPWNMYSGYCLKSDGAIDMDFCGEYLEELNVELDQGWNLVPMLSKTPVSSDFIFGFNDDILIVKQVAGWKVLWKEMGINTLGFVNPGKAYFVYCTAPTSITYPYYTDQVLPEPKPDEPIISPFEAVAPTPVSHVVAFSDDAIRQLQAGDIVAAFNQSGMCCGQVQIDDEQTSLALFGDDAYTESPDGLMEGEKIQYRLYRPEEDRYFDLDLSWDESHQKGNTFLAHGISVATNIKLSGVGISKVEHHNVSVYPNPTTGTVHISGIQGNYVVEVYNAVREKIQQAKLTGESDLNLSPYPKGIYMLKITTSDYSFTEKVVLN